jgi:hypothetical protein
MPHGIREIQRVYTGLGLWRVKPYVQFLIIFLWMWLDTCPRGNTLALLILANGQGRWTQSPGRLHTWKPISSRLQHNPVMFRLSGGTIDVLCLVLHAKLPHRSNKVVWGNLLEGLRDHISCLLGPLSGKQVFWWVRPTCRGRPWEWSVGT